MSTLCIYELLLLPIPVLAEVSWVVMAVNGVEMNAALCFEIKFVLMEFRYLVYCTTLHLIPQPRTRKKKTPR